MMATAKEHTTVSLRMPKTLRKQLMELAKQEQRSLSNQIIVILGRALESKREAA